MLGNTWQPYRGTSHPVHEKASKSATNASNRMVVTKEKKKENKKRKEKKTRLVILVVTECYSLTRP